MDHLLDEEDIMEYKERLVEPEWKVSSELLQGIRNNINALSLTIKDGRRDREPKISHFDHSKIKRKSESKLKQSASSNLFAHTALTPNNKSKEKKVKHKKSPEA
jgi:hypothetical protein